MTTQPQRIALDDLTSDALDALYDQLGRAERIARSAALDASVALTAQLAAEFECDRYRTAWASARHRAAMHLQSNQNFAASIDNGHAAYLQLATEVARLTAGQCTHSLAVCETHHAVPVAGCPYPRCRAARATGRAATA